MLHTYYQADESLKKINLDETYWSHAGYWDNQWDDEYCCEKRYIINNKGKDIGGKLFLMKCLLEQNVSEKYVLFLHDKKSPQVVDGEKWKDELWNINKRENLTKAINLLNTNESIGIVANHTSIVNPKIAGDAYAYATNKEFIFDLANRYNISPNDKSFVGGTMFVARLKPYLDFFSENDPLVIRAALEQGNVLDLDKGTLTHSWERLLSWILTSKGYSIEGI